jgi:hypothetical protein
VRSCQPQSLARLHPHTLSRLVDALAEDEYPLVELVLILASDALSLAVVYRACFLAVRLLYVVNELA